MTRRSRPDARSVATDRRAVRPPCGAAPHEVLGLKACEEDAVRVIEVAHLLLRRWRQVSSREVTLDDVRPSGREASNRIREILRARQAMLERIHAGWRCP